MRSWLELLVAALAALAVPAAPAVPGQEADPWRAELEVFLARLGELRSGEAFALAGLQASAQRLCERWGRCDALEVAGFYAALTPAERARGLAAEARYLELRGEVVEAGLRGLAGPEWATLRAGLLEELLELAADTEREPDFVPAAQARSLAARIQVERLESDLSLSPEERAALAAEAERQAREASELFERAGQVTPRLEPLWLAGRIERFRGDPEGARESFQACLAAAERARSDDFREHALRGLVSLARDAGDMALRARLLSEIATFRDPRESWPLARDWAEHLLALDHAPQALELLERCAPPPGAPVADGIEHDLLTGSARLRLGDVEGARAPFERLAMGPAVELGLLALARLALEDGRAFDALDLLEQPEVEDFSEEGRAQARSLLGETLLSIGDARAAARELQASLELAERWSERQESRPLEDPAGAAVRDVIGEWIGLHTVALLAEAQAELGEPLEAARAIEDWQARTLRRGRGEPPAPLGADDLAAWAARSELGLVTWVAGADFGVVAHVAPDRSAWAARIDVGRSALQDAARRLREAAIADRAEELQALAADVRAKLLPEELLERLRALAPPDDPHLSGDVRLAGRARLLVLLHGPLEALPFELLEIDGAPIDERLTLRALPGLSSPRPGEAPAPDASGGWQLLGAPLGPSGEALLPGAAAELASVRSRLAAASRAPGAGLAQESSPAEASAGASAGERDQDTAQGRSAELFSPSDASRASEVSYAAGADFDRRRATEALARGGPVHIATHLVPFCAPDWSIVHDPRFASGGLLLSGGDILCSHQIAALAPRSPLVVLSACETAGGRALDAEGLQGVARAFLESGTRNLLVTLWPVDDRAARDFALAFHDHLAAGLPPSRATRNARVHLRQSGWPAAEWAAFRLLGRD